MEKIVRPRMVYRAKQYKSGELDDLVLWLLTLGQCFSCDGGDSTIRIGTQRVAPGFWVVISDNHVVVLSGQELAERWEAVQ